MPETGLGKLAHLESGGDARAIVDLEFGCAHAALDAAAGADLDELLGDDVAHDRAAHDQAAHRQVGFDRTRLAHDQDALRDGVALEVTVHAHGAAETDLAFEGRTDVEESLEFVFFHELPPSNKSVSRSSSPSPK